MRPAKHCCLATSKTRRPLPPRSSAGATNVASENATSFATLDAGWEHLFRHFPRGRGGTGARERKVVLEHARHGAGKFYALAAVVVMPDHVHLLLQPRRAFDLSRVLKGMRGVSGRLVNESRGKQGTIWQDESRDRIVQRPGGV